MIRKNAMAEEVDPPLLLHITTVSQTLNFVADQIEYAKRKGLVVHALSSPSDALQEFGERLAIPVHELPMERRITPLRDLRALWRLNRTLQKLQPQIVHGHTPKGGLLAMLAAWWRGVPVRVYHVHGLPIMTATGLRRFWLRWSERMSCKLASQVYCVSASVRDVSVAEGLCPAEKIKVLLNGTISGICAADRFNPARVDAGARLDVRHKHNIPADALVLGFAGRMVRDKGIIELAQAWKVLRAEFPNLHLLMLGRFEPEDPVPPEVENLLRNDDRVHLTGWLGVKETPQYYRAMDLLALPTYREGFGLVLLEAGAMELPVVASRIPGCIDAVVEGETGALVPARDAAALTEALRAYLRDPELRRKHGQAGRERVMRDFRPDDMNKAIYQEYVRLLRERGIIVTPESEGEIAYATESIVVAERQWGQTEKGLLS